MQPATKGMVNGIGQALAALGRSIGPALGAPVFAWSESTGKRAVHSIGRLAASLLLSQFLLMIVYNYNHILCYLPYLRVSPVSAILALSLLRSWLASEFPLCL